MLNSSVLLSLRLLSFSSAAHSATLKVGPGKPYVKDDFAKYGPDDTINIFPFDKNAPCYQPGLTN